MANLYAVLTSGFEKKSGIASNTEICTYLHVKNSKYIGGTKLRAIDRGYYFVAEINGIYICMEFDRKDRLVWSRGIEKKGEKQKGKPSWCECSGIVGDTMCAAHFVLENQQ